MGNVVALLVLLFFSMGAWAQGIFEHPVETDAQRQRLESIADHLHSALPVSGKIVQTKHMSILHEPLVSRGDFSLADNGDIRWHIREPFDVHYRVQDNRITRTVDGERETITASQEPSVYGFFQIVDRLFALNIDALADFFHVYLAPAHESEGQWDLALTPRYARLQQSIARILVSGSEGYIHSVIVAEPGDDYSEIRFDYSGSTGD